MRSTSCSCCSIFVAGACFSISDVGLADGSIQCGPGSGLSTAVHLQVWLEQADWRMQGEGGSPQLALSILKKARQVHLAALLSPCPPPPSAPLFPFDPPQPHLPFFLFIIVSITSGCHTNWAKATIEWMQSFAAHLMCMCAGSQICEHHIGLMLAQL